MQFKVPKAREPLTAILVKSVGKASTFYLFPPSLGPKLQNLSVCGRNYSVIFQH